MSVNSYLLTISASLCGALAFTVEPLWFLSVPAVALLLLDLTRAQSKNNAFVRGLLFGIATGGASIWWAWDALPFLWLGYTSPWEGAYVMAIIWGLVSVGLGVSIALYGALVWQLRNKWYVPLIATLLWPVAEWGRMWMFSLLAAGENSLLGPHFSFGALSYTLADSSVLLSVAQHGGVFALSFILAVLAYLLIAVVQFKNAQHWWIAGLTLVLVLSLPKERELPKVQKPVTVALVHTVRHDTGLPMSFHTALTEAKSADIVVIPEDLFMFGTTTTQESLASIAGMPKKMLVAFPEREIGEDGLYKNSALLADQSGVLAKYQKQFLMPEGEYSPFLSKWIFSLIGDARVDAYFGSTRRLQQGAREPALTHGGWVLRGLMCSDIISPYVAQIEHSNTPAMLINIGDQTWFNTSKLLHRRLIQMAKVRAVENNAFVAVANRGSPSYLIDPRGIVLVESVWGTEGIVYATIK